MALHRRVVLRREGACVVDDCSVGLAAHPMWGIGCAQFFRPHWPLPPDDSCSEPGWDARGLPLDQAYASHSRRNLRRHWQRLAVRPH
jgi:hypothetical protein